ncbi:MAG: DUF4442 domain-containing protein [Chitinophagales bacterium]|nr:DUF4442 domain-containing protein [Chitinophagales bacterium]
MEAFIKLVRNRWKFGFFLFSKLPAAWLAGVRVKHLEPAKAEVTVPYKWLSQNPFRSTYFACLSMAAEMSTGLLAMGHTYQRKPSVSMLVVKLEGDFFKKATGLTAFTCEDGDKIKAVIEEAILTGEARSVKAKTVGKNDLGDLVAEFYITWSFKAKQKI